MWLDFDSWEGFHGKWRVGLRAGEDEWGCETVDLVEEEGDVEWRRERDPACHGVEVGAVSSFDC